MLPALLAVVLASRGFGFTYFFDDFDFLERAQSFHASYLLPDPQSVFYRPVSRELTFAAINALGPASLVGAHLWNALLLATAVILLGLLAGRLAGPRAGFAAALAFSMMGQLPLLVGWVSGVQDLLAICFALAALNLRLRGHPWLAMLSLALAILSKETAIAFVPILVGMDLLLRRGSDRILREAAGYAALIGAWAAVHPGIRALSTGHGTGTSAHGYVGVSQPTLWSSLAKTFVTAANLPLTGAGTPWPSELNTTLLLASLLLIGGLLWIWPALRRHPSAESAPAARSLLLAVALLIVPAFLTCFVVGQFQPYYATIPAIGVSLLVGVALRKAPAPAPLAVLLALLVLGIWGRGMALDPSITTERNVARSSLALRRVESGFKRLRPRLPANSRAYVSCQVQGTESVSIHVTRYQPLRVWYRDPTILTLSPRRLVGGDGERFLFWISPTLDVFEVDPQSLEPRGNGPTPQLSEYLQLLRGYSFGLAGAGEVDRAVRILTELPQMNEIDRSIDHRLAAMYLFDAGRDPEALELMARTAPVDSLTAVPMVADVMLDTVPRRSLDRVALRAFGFRCTLEEMYRRYMRWFDEYHFTTEATQFARKLQTVVPGDAESAQLLRRLGSNGQARITTPVTLDSL